MIRFLSLQPLRRYARYIFLCSAIMWVMLFLWRNFYGEPIQTSTWTCEGLGMCEFTNFCIDRYHGPFVITSQDPPRINLLNTGEGEDLWFKPKAMKRGVGAKYIDEDVFVYGLYSPYHFSHFIYNGLMPLYSTMREKNASSSAWTLRVATWKGKHTKLEMILPSGPDMVLQRKDRLTEKQVLPTYKPLCFRKAVVGSGNRCALWYCDGQIPSSHYESFSSYVVDQPITEPSQCLSSVITYKHQPDTPRIAILNRGRTRHITNIPEVIDALSAMNVSIETIDFDAGCNMRSTAELVKDVDVLIAPFGNGLGAGLFMKKDAVLISIASRWYNEDWFKWPMTAVGRRIYNFECRNAICQEYDRSFLTSILDQYNLKLNETEIQALLTQEYPIELLSKYIPGREREMIEQYYKDVRRRIDVKSFIPFLKDILDTHTTNLSYVEQCRLNQCCNDVCQWPLERNVFGKMSAYQNK